MHYRILVATDGSQVSGKAASAAIELARNYPGSRIIGLSLTEPMPLRRMGMVAGMDMIDHELHEQGLAQTRVDRIAEMARAAGVPCETLVEHAACIQEGILKVASMHKCNCIFVAWKSRAAKNGATFRKFHKKLLTDASVPVVIYH